MHPTQALGMLHLPTSEWHREALDSLGLGRLHVPLLADLTEPIGLYSVAGRKLPCYSALGDQQCALRGAGLQVGELSLNISTGSQVSRRTSTLELGPYQTRPYFDGDYLNTITHLPAGRSLNVLVDLLTELARAEGVTLAKAWDYIAEAAAGADGSGLECDLAFFAGPLGDSGSVRGITTENLTVGNLFHAALVNMADNYARCADRLWPARSWRQIALSGGLTQSLPILRTLLERRFAAPIRESAAAEDTLLGLLDVARSLAGASRQ
jgi:sugar (pentulose or hexulose) kinase